MKTPQLLCLLLLTVHGILNAQPEAVPKRPKVGLVLSGGAAKGFAHIGVLKVLEEAGLQPDLITGTSMGSIIGGLYAIGYKADSLERLVAMQDWDNVLSDRVGLRNVIFEEKDFFENQLVQLPLVDGKLQPPSGLIHGHQVDNLLTQLTLPAYRTSNFRQLPTPFRCVSADILNGRPYVHDEGRLARAMRASMAIPTLFTPMELDSIVLIDGGLIRNFPVQEAKDWGADIVIGVYTGWVKADKEELQSFSKIMMQSGFLMSLQDTEEQMPMVDYYIEPNMEDYASQDFDKAAEIIREGELAARQMLPRLQALADSLQTFSRPDTAARLPALDSILIDSLAVQGNERFTAAEIIGRSKLKTGHFYRPQELQQAIDHLMGTNYFQKVTYHLEPQEEALILVIDCIERAPTLLKTAINYDNYLGAGFLFNFTSRNLLFPASRFMLIGTVAEQFRLRLNHLKYLGKEQKWAWITEFWLSRDKVPIFQNGLRNEEYRLLESVIDIRLQRRLGTNHAIGLGVQREQPLLRSSVSPQPFFESFQYTNHNAYVFWEANSLDRNIFPTSGSRLSFEIKGLFNTQAELTNLNPDASLSADSLAPDAPFLRLALHSENYFPLHRKASLILRPFGGLTTNPGNTFGDFFLIGAPAFLTRRSIPFYGLKPNQLVAQVVLGTGIGYQQFITKNLMVSLNANAAVLAQPGPQETRLPRPNEFIAGLGLSGGYNTIIGPVKLSLMYPLAVGAGGPDDFLFFLSIGHRF